MVGLRVKLHYFMLYLYSYSSNHPVCRECLKTKLQMFKSDVKSHEMGSKVQRSCLEVNIILITPLHVFIL